MRFPDYADDKAIITNLTAKDKIHSLREMVGILYKARRIKEHDTH